MTRISVPKRCNIGEVNIPKHRVFAPSSGLQVSDGRFSVDCRAQLVFGIGQVLATLQESAQRTSAAVRHAQPFAQVRCLK